MKKELAALRGNWNVVSVKEARKDLQNQWSIVEDSLLETFRLLRKDIHQLLQLSNPSACTASVLTRTIKSTGYARRLPPAAAAFNGSGALRQRKRPSVLDEPASVSDNAARRR